MHIAIRSSDNKLISALFKFLTKWPHPTEATLTILRDTDDVLESMAAAGHLTDELEHVKHDLAKAKIGIEAQNKVVTMLKNDLHNEQLNHQSVIDASRKIGSHAWYCTGQLGGAKCNCPQQLLLVFELGISTESRYRQVISDPGPLGSIIT